MTRMIGSYSVVLAILFASSPALAQTDTEKIRARVKHGQKVSITDDQGQEIKGRISTMTADGLTILVDGGSADVPYDRIVRIDRPNDSLANGALIGFGVGAALGLTAIAAEAHRDCDPLAWFGCSEPGAAPSARAFW
jgi:thiamine pyrophosphate-dependent acetolactate synthase large subunit-like protein